MEKRQDSPADAEHDTLKYHLLGPSLLKAGQDSVDQKKVENIEMPTSLQYLTNDYWRYQ